MFNENEDPMDVSEINDQTNLIAIVEILGIKCSSRNFQIDMECKQMMVIKPEKIFEKCVITLGNKMERNNPEVVVEDGGFIETCSGVAKPKSSIDDEREGEEEELVQETSSMDDVSKLLEMETQSSTKKEQAIVLASYYDDVSCTKEQVLPTLTTMNDNAVTDDTYLGEDGTSSLPFSEMVEIDVSLDNLYPTEPIHLKKRNDVYYDIYKQAKQKAKEAKNIAVRMYLESKQIKDLYKLDDVHDSDDDDNHEENV